MERKPSLARVLALFCMLCLVPAIGCEKDALEPEVPELASDSPAEPEWNSFDDSTADWLGSGPSHRRETWVAVAHDAGYAWAWKRDPEFKVLVVEESHDEWTLGIHLLYGDHVHSQWVEDLGGAGVDRYLYLILGVPRADGTAPLVSARGDLVLALQGSGEHGCDALGADLITVRVRPHRMSGIVRVLTFIEGIVYMGFPPDGRFSVIGSGVEAGTPNRFDAGEMESGVDSFEYEDFVRLRASGTSLGTLQLVSPGKLPWLQLQSHSGFLEVDMDHSCEYPSFQGSRLALITEVPR